MHSHSQTRGRILLLTTSLGLFSAFCPIASSQNLPDVSRPQTGGEWGQLLTPIGEIQGTFAPQPYMDAVEAGLPTLQPLIEDDLLLRLQQDKPALFSVVQVVPDSQHPVQTDTLNLSTYTQRPLTLLDYNQIAEKIGKHCQEQKQLCQISFSQEQGENNTPVLQASLKAVQLKAVQIETKGHLRASAVKRVLGIKENGLLDLGTLEKKLRLLQDNPDIQANAELEAVEMEPVVNLKVTAKAERSLHLASFWNNLDQTYYGGQVAGISSIANNVTGNADTLMVTAIPDKQEHGVYTHYEIPINAYGTRFGVDYSYMRANPKGFDYNPYNVRGRAWGLTTTLNQTLIAKENLRVSADLNFDVQQFRSRSEGLIIERENMRNLRAGIQLAQSGENHEFASRHEVTIGLPIMRATPNSKLNLGNPGGGSQFFRYIGSFYYLRNLPGNMAAVLNGVGQWSPGSLSSMTLGGIGGTYWGRGYPEAFVQADSLLYGSAELRFPAFMIPKQLKLPKDTQSIHDKIRFLTFFDYAYAKVNDRSVVPDPNTSIASTGIGVRVDFCKNLSGRLDLGIPLIRPSRDMMPINHYHPRIHFGLQAHVF